jgi:hypothetical protein
MAIALVLAANSSAQTIWSGLTLSFTKEDFADVNLPANQDRITDDVWLTRNVLAGIININQETEYAALSPLDTEWATDLMPANDGKTIVAANWADLTFTNWIGAYGGPASLQLPTRLIDRDAVVHLITHDIYLDLRFTDWTERGGGGFSYDRAEGIVPPTTNGDYNGNGFVDAADYVVWRKTLNQLVVPAGSGADGNSSGRIDVGDFNIWRRSFGDTVPGAGSGAYALGVPEPTTTVLVLLGLASAAAASRKRR